MLFTKEEIKRNLLGSLEVALLMPVARKRFGKTYNEAVRSFVIPILMFPFAMALVYAHPHPNLADASNNTIALLYSLRTFLTWALFLGSVYWIVKQIDRKEHFWQFVIATNWLAVPATVIFLPVMWMLFSGAHTWAELFPFMLSMVGYTYFFTAFAAAYILRLPWELAGFIAMISFMINDWTGQLLSFVGEIL
ncbi:MAG: hypothetical protein HY370_02815 [Proteobacteria bacterium]|nr:hypothetical protein [Pseudomonadota bacterium]